MQSIVKKLFVILSCTFLITACSNMSPEKQAGSETKDTGAWDADSRNNEDASLGAKRIASTPRPGMKTLTMDNTIAHYNSGMFMKRDLADHVVRMAHVPAAAVAVTNNHVYVAVDVSGRSAALQSGQPYDFKNDPTKGAGLFGSGEGSKLDWNSAEPLSKEASQIIFKEMRHYLPDGNVYISTNPNFVNRMVFYDLQQHSGQIMGHYLNEFNTMVQYVFPEYSNGTNHMLTK
jgi:hypothetical protein